MTNNDKDLWRERWLGSINELTSFELQNKSWLDRKQLNPHWSFVEFRCCYFDDLVIHDNYKIQLESGWITTQEYEIIKDWHEAMGKYNPPNEDYYNHEAILKDTKWLDLLQTGMNVKNKLANYLNGNEKQLLTEEINYLNFV